MVSRGKETPECIVWHQLSPLPGDNERSLVRALAEVGRFWRTLAGLGTGAQREPGSSGRPVVKVQELPDQTKRTRTNIAKGTISTQ